MNDLEALSQELVQEAGHLEINVRVFEEMVKDLQGNMAGWYLKSIIDGFYDSLAKMLIKRKGQCMPLRMFTRCLRYLFYNQFNEDGRGQLTEIVPGVVSPGIKLANKGSVYNEMVELGYVTMERIDFKNYVEILEGGWVKERKRAMNRDLGWEYFEGVGEDDELDESNLENYYNRILAQFVKAIGEAEKKFGRELLRDFPESYPHPKITGFCPIIWDNKAFGDGLCVLAFNGYGEK